MWIRADIAGIPAILDVISYEPPHPGGVDEPTYPGEIAVEVRDIRGKPEEGLKHKLIDDGVELETVKDIVRKEVGVDREAWVKLV